MSAGKGDRPRNNFSRQFRANFDRINWKTKPKIDFYETSHGTDPTWSDFFAKHLKDLAGKGK